MLKNSSQDNHPRHAPLVGWLFVILLITVVAVVVWTEQTQHKTIQEASRAIILKQLSAAFSSLLRDQPESLVFIREAQMIGKERGTAFCSSLNQTIEVNPELASIIDPYLHTIDYDAAMPDRRWSGWYLQFEDNDLHIGSCISSTKKEVITR